MEANKKTLRHKNLKKLLRANPFSTDEELASLLSVSVPTIRLDRATLGIPELRTRTKEMAIAAQNKLRSIGRKEIVGELLDLELNRQAISMMKVTSEMISEKTELARGFYMYAMANTLALAVVDAEKAITEVGNIKYKLPVEVGSSLIAKAVVTKHRESRFFIYVSVKNDGLEVFRAKFIIANMDEAAIVREEA